MSRETLTQLWTNIHGFINTRAETFKTQQAQNTYGNTTANALYSQISIMLNDLGFAVNQSSYGNQITPGWITQLAEQEESSEPPSATVDLTQVLDKLDTINYNITGQYKKVTSGDLTVVHRVASMTEKFSQVRTDITSAEGRLTTKINDLPTHFSQISTDITAAFDDLAVKLRGDVSEGLEASLSGFGVALQSLIQIFEDKNAGHHAEMISSYKGWVQSLTATVGLLKAYSESSIVVSNDIQAIITTAYQVIERLGSLMNATGDFREWLDDKMVVLRENSNNISELTASIAKNVELKEASTKREQTVATVSSVASIVTALATATFAVGSVSKPQSLRKL